jgi:hypothetical protein
MYITTEMKKKQVYSILIDNWDEEITGVFIAEGKEWIVLYDNQNDFLVEGFRFIRKQKIEEVLREEDECFKEKIFNLKYPKLSFNSLFNLDNTVALLKGIQKQNTLLHFDTDDEEEIIVGKIEEVNLTNFKLKSLTSNGKWGESCSCDFSEISSIAIQNDYLNSLSLLFQS